MIETEEIMQTVAELVDKILKSFCTDKLGFVILVHKLHTPGLGNYVSNCKRDDMIKALREAADRIEKNEIIPPTIGSA